MRRIDKISLHGLLPRAFADVACRQSVEVSQVWLGELTFNRGERYILTAGSGSGKSSLCSYIYGNRSDYEGTILFNGDDISRFGHSRWSEMRMRHIALLPQEMRLFPELTVLENIELKNRLTRFKTAGEIMDMLALLEIADKTAEPVARLSIGQQQRVALVRALCQPMDFLILDEPVSHLDAHCNRLAALLVERETAHQEAAVIVTSVGNALSIEAQPIKL